MVKSVSCYCVGGSQLFSNQVRIYKKGVKSDPNNYRPISLTSDSQVLSKGLECLIRDNIATEVLSYPTIDTKLKVSTYVHEWLFV